MTSEEFVKKVIDVAKNYKTLYVMGCFGAPILSSNVKRYTSNHKYNTTSTRKAMIKSVADKGYFGFDCVNLIKGILWGWNGNKQKSYGGAKYAINDVPDIGADKMITKCTGVTTNFSKIEVGEAVWLSGHIGIYIGNGLAVECSPKWKNGVQITAVGNIGAKKGYNTRYWTKHGKLPYISYAKKAETTKKSIAAIAKEVIAGDWGNGAEREKKLKAAGYNPDEVQKAVNATLAGKAEVKAYTGGFPTLPKKGCLEKGDNGEQVKKLQKFLNWCIGAGLEVDGDFGTKTNAAVEKYQEAHGLEVDGKFGAKSLAKAKEIKK